MYHKSADKHGLNFLLLNKKQDRKYIYNVTLRRYRVTTFVVEKQ
jgi:hypothetical protein